MHHPLLPRALAVLALAAACTHDAPDERAPATAASSPAPAPADPPATVAEAKDAAAPRPTATPPATPAPAPAAVLRPIALRTDPVRLLRQRDAPLLVLDGEPLTYADGAFVRHPVGSHGLVPRPEGGQGPALAAVDLAEPLGAWVTSGFGNLRFGARYVVHHREQASWTRLGLGKGLILAYYAAYVERDGALLALRSWAVDPEQEALYFLGPDELAEVFPRKLEKAEAKAEQAWIRLAGAEGAALPVIGKGMRVHDQAITTADGTLWALASTSPSVVVDTQEIGSEAMEEEEEADGEPRTPQPTFLLMWPPGKVEPERIEVPELASATEVALHDGGDAAIIAGMREGESYLALGHGTQWERVPVRLPADAPIPSVHVQGAAKTPEGELWIAFGHPVDGRDDGQPVWRKPAGGEWQPVAMPEVRGDAVATHAWEYQAGHGWTPARRSTEPVVLGEASDLVWAAGAIWVVVGPVFSGQELIDQARHAVVLTTLAGDAPPAVLVPSWKQELEAHEDRVRTSKPGSEGCTSPTLVLGPGSLVGSEGAALPAFVDQIAETRLVEGGASIRSIYLAEGEHGPVVVAEATAASTKRALALREAVATTMAGAGVPAKDVVAQCSVPMVTRMLHAPEPAQ